MVAEREIITEKTEKNKYDFFTLARMIMLVFVFGGVFGFIYEEIFYRIDLGYFVKRGTTLGPWIPIYGFGALLILLSTYKLRKKAWLVFLVGGAVCGILEFITGYSLYHLADKRLWDYNTEILNFGNINGYICLRSVLFFACSSLFLIYIVVPLIKYIYLKLPRIAFTLLSSILALMFFMDFFAANVIHIY